VGEFKAGLPDYRCLSYLWGSREHTCWISMNNRPFQVRKDLWDFLDAIVFDWTCMRDMWIDALCI
jgi:hypothetical protein